MTMHDQIHPDDERLAALAGADPEAVRDAALAAHLADCSRCTELVDELHMLRTALSELPDLLPSRPLQLVPTLPDAQPSTGWLRRLFAPMLVAGSALVLVGVVGLTNLDVTLMPTAASFDRSRGEVGEAASPPNRDSAGDPLAPGTASASEAPANGVVDLGTDEPFTPDLGVVALLTGIVLIVGALLLRFVVVPRAG
jgi:predicted anti-sigma-YlaC factor YlaD